MLNTKTKKYNNYKVNDIFGSIRVEAAPQFQSVAISLASISTIVLNLMNNNVYKSSQNTVVILINIQNKIFSWKDTDVDDNYYLRNTWPASLWPHC